MKWPWVSRELYDVARLESEAARAAGQQYAEWLVAADARYDALLEKFTALRVQGAVPELPPIVPTAAQTARIEIQQPDELRDLIHEKAGTDFRRRGLMLAQLKRDRADGVAEETIRERIEDGVQSEGIPL